MAIYHQYLMANMSVKLYYFV